MARLQENQNHNHCHVNQLFNMKKFFTRRLKGFALIEVAIALAILGVLSVAVVGGLSMLDNAKIDKQVNTVTTIIALYDMHKQTYGSTNDQNIEKYIKEQINMDNSIQVNVDNKTITINTDKKHVEKIYAKLTHSLPFTEITKNSDKITIKLQ